MWTYGSTVNAPSQRATYTATMLTNGVIVYIGGQQFGKLIDINQISLYDTKLGTWSAMVCLKLNNNF
jgi:hypothetical protein